MFPVDVVFVTIDEKFNFDLNIDIICKSSSNKVNALKPETFFENWGKKRLFLTVISYLTLMITL